MLLAGLCRMYGLSLTDAKALQLWEVEVLVESANQELREQARAARG